MGLFDMIIAPDRFSVCPSCGGTLSLTSYDGPRHCENLSYVHVDRFDGICGDCPSAFEFIRDPETKEFVTHKCHAETQKRET